MGNQSITASANCVTAEDRQTDMELVEAVRAGNEDAYAELWARHYASAVRVAQSITTTFDPDDMVQEAFSSLLIAIRSGDGPHTAFRAYLMTSVKNIAMTWARARREVATEDLESHLDPIDSDLEMERQIDRCITREAFLSLPERWQRVLWHTEIEEMSTAEVAELMGIKPGAVAQLAFRAREGLRESWLSSHLRVTKDSSDECRWVIKRAGAYARGNSSSRDAARIEKHREHCPSCPEALKEARSVNKRLLILLPPIIAAGTAISAAVALTGKPVVTAATSVILLVAAVSVMVAMNTGPSTEPGMVASVPLLEPTLELAPGTHSSQPPVETYGEVEGLLPSNPPQALPPRTNDPATEPAHLVSASAQPRPTPSRSLAATPEPAPVPRPVPSASMGAMAR